MSYLKNITFFIAVAVAITCLSNLIQSTFIKTFIVDDLVTVLVTIFAINTATNSLLIDDLSKLSKSTNQKFSNSYKEIKVSIYEQIILIGMSVVFLICRESALLKDYMNNELIFDTLCLAAFIYAIDILRDTALAVFNLIEFRNKTGG